VFAVRRIVATGADRVTQEQLVEATSSSMGQNLLRLSTADVKKALLALPYVESVEVIRTFPDTLEIRVEEHKPIARLRSADGRDWLVSDAGDVLEDSDPALLPELPLVVPQAMSIAAGMELSRTILSVLPLAEYLGSGEMQGGLPPISSIAVSGAGFVSLLLEGGGELRLGAPTDWREKLQVAWDVVRKCQIEGKKIEYVDVSVVDRVAVKAK